jgi:hypothetical protein
MFLIIMEIGAHPGAQIDRFPHIDHPAICIFHQVTAGFIGQRIQDPLKMIRYSNHRAQDSNTTSDQQPAMLSNLQANYQGKDSLHFKSAKNNALFGNRHDLRVSKSQNLTSESLFFPPGWVIFTEIIKKSLIQFA